MRGALLMTGGMAGFTLNDTFMKALSDELPLMQAIGLRGIFTSIALLAIGYAMGSLHLRIAAKDWGLLVIRSVAEIGAAVGFLTALFHMPFANTSAILQVVPLAITLVAAIVFNERLGWRRLLAIAIGFVGVMLIVKPGTSGFNTYSLYALFCVAMMVIRDVATRKMTSGIPSLTVALGAAVFVGGYGLYASTFEPWAPVSTKAAMQIGGAVTFVILGLLCTVMTMRVGEIGFIAPFRYTSMIFALLVGFFVFSEWPDYWTLLGAAIVVATGLFTLYRERVARHAK
jgi:drug/metabolite transporter (DMT)-like permease